MWNLTPDVMILVGFYSGQLRRLVCVSGAWSLCMRSVRTSIAQSFWMSDVDMTLVADWHSPECVKLRVARLMKYHLERDATVDFWYEGQVRLRMFVDEVSCVVSDFVKHCWHQQQAYDMDEVLGQWDEGIIVLAKRFEAQGFVLARDLRCQRLGRTVREVVHTLYLLSVPHTPESCGCDCGGCVFDTELPIEVHACSERACRGRFQYDSHRMDYFHAGCLVR
jgi:hypothetical protein